MSRWQSIYARARQFDPRTIQGLAMWLDASDSSTVTLASGAVSEWRDKSGNSRNAAQTVANNRPATVTVNGRTAVSFDGMNDGLEFTGVARTDETWIIAAAQTVDQSGTRMFISNAVEGFGIASAKGSVRLLVAYFGDFAEGVGRLRPYYNSNPAIPLGPAVLSVVRSAASGGFVFIDGTQRPSVVNGAASFTTSGSVAISRIGYFNSSTLQLQGWIGEILCYSRPLTAAERQTAERYLGKKWGIVVA